MPHYFLGMWTWCLPRDSGISLQRFHWCEDIVLLIICCCIDLLLLYIGGLKCPYALSLSYYIGTCRVCSEHSQSNYYFSFHTSKLNHFIWEVVKQRLNSVLWWTLHSGSWDLCILIGKMWKNGGDWYDIIKKTATICSYYHLIKDILISEKKGRNDFIVRLCPLNWLN